MRFILLIISFVLVGGHLQAQRMSKEEKKIYKEWKKKLKSTSLEDLKAMHEEKDQLNQELRTLEAELQELRDQLATKDNQISALESRNQQLKRQIEENAQRKNEEKGIFFKVQLSFTDEDASGNTVNRYYTLGIFRSYEDAVAFRDAVRKLGIKDAYVQGYKDGERRPVDELRGMQ
ncbi:hypothetical protein [Thermonema rossianum]|jgi:DNA repair exonuclease SbcCD ATPase subunit|uniref:hypothetical protein n=1 Tax=Thermonema rossianum TaxID=55505 RepID=UPI000571237F|nr:hypothetical protein [Thermonema rossianum]